MFIHASPLSGQPSGVWRPNAVYTHLDKSRGAALTYEEWAMEFADSDDSSFYFYADAGPSTVTVADDGKQLSVTISMSGAIGEQFATAQINSAG